MMSKNCMLPSIDGRFCSFPSWGPIPRPPHGHSWNSLMSSAMVMAQLGGKNDEVPVGAIIVNQHGTVLAQAHNETISSNDPTAHAEVLAIRRACLTLKNCRLNHCILVATLEPCLMCVGAISESRLAGVVYGAADARAGAICSLIDGFSYFPTNPAPWFFGGVEAQACSEILVNFFKSKR